LSVTSCLADIFIAVCCDFSIGYAFEGEEAFSMRPRKATATSQPRWLSDPTPVAPNAATLARRRRWLFDSILYAIIFCCYPERLILLLCAIVAIHRSVTAAHAPEEASKPTIAGACSYLVEAVFSGRFQAIASCWTSIYQLQRCNPKAKFGITPWIKYLPTEFKSIFLTVHPEVVKMPHVSYEEQHAKKAHLSKAAGLNDGDAEWLLAAFHWQLDDFLTPAQDGTLRAILQENSADCDRLLCTIAAEVFGSSLSPSPSMRVACNQVQEGFGRRGPVAWRDDIPVSCNWCLLEEETGLKGRSPMLRLVDSPTEMHNMPHGGSWAYAIAGVIIAQMRWKLWKAGSSPIDTHMEACIQEELHNFACDAAVGAMRSPCEEVAAAEAVGDFARFAASVQGNISSRASRVFCAGIKVTRSGLLQTSWAERYGFDAPHPTCAAFTHFVKQWLFNYGPLYATMDGSALQYYTGGILSAPAADPSTEPVARTCGVLVVGYHDTEVGEDGKESCSVGHWLCRSDMGAGATFGEMGFFRVAYGALGINDAVQFMVLELCEKY